MTRFLVFIALLAAAVAGFVGFVMNIFTLFSLETFAGEGALRTVGVFIPILGAILGWV